VAQITNLYEAWEEALIRPGVDKPNKFIKLPDELKSEAICLQAVSYFNNGVVMEKVLAAIPERYKTRELYLAMVLHSIFPEYLNHVPQKFLTNDFFLDKARFSRFSWIMSDQYEDPITERFITAELCDIMARKTDDESWLGWFKQVPDHLKTPEMCRLAVLKHPSNLEFVPDTLKTPELCRKGWPPSVFSHLYPPSQTPAGYCMKKFEEDTYFLRFFPEELKTKELCLKAVRKEGLTLRWVTEQTPEICEAAVENCGTAIAYAKYQTEAMCLKAVREHGLNLQFVQKQTAQICLEAVRNFCIAFRFVEPRFLNREICLTAVRGDGDLLAYVPPETDGYAEICMEAVKQYPESVRYVKDHACGNSFEAIYLEAVKKKGNCVNFGTIKDKRSLNVCKEALKQNPMVFQNFTESEKTPEMCLLAVSLLGSNIRYIENQSPEICLAAVRQNGNALKWVKEQTLELCIEAVKHNRLALNFVKEEFASSQEILLAAEKSELKPLVNDYYLQYKKPYGELHKLRQNEGYTHVEVPEGINLINENIFSENPIKTIVLAPSVIVVAPGAFMERDMPSKLESVTIGFILRNPFSEDHTTRFGDIDFDTSFRGVYTYNCKAAGTYKLNRSNYTWSFNGKQLPYRRRYRSQTEVNKYGKAYIKEDSHYYGENGEAVAVAAFRVHGHIASYNTYVDKSRGDYPFMWLSLRLWVFKPFEMRIPEKVDGLPVEGLAEFLFNNSGNQRYITKIILPPGLKYLGDSAFEYCENIKEMHIPAGVEFIGACAFYGCVSLQSITVDRANKHFKVIDGVLFDSSGESLICYPPDKEGSSYKVPAGVRYIRPGAFAFCRHLRSIDLPASDCNIGEMVFDQCVALESITLPDGLLGISIFLFRGCISLKKVVLPEGIRAIDFDAFKNCSSLEEINIPSSVVYIAKEAFMNCRSLERIHLPNVGILEYHVFAGCTNLRHITMPMIQEIGENTISFCKYLNHLYLPPNCKMTSFKDTPRLVTVTLPAGLEDIPMFDSPNVDFAAVYSWDKIQLGNFTQSAWEKLKSRPKSGSVNVHVIDKKSLHTAANILPFVESGSSTESSVTPSAPSVAAPPPVAPSKNSPPPMPTAPAWQNLPPVQYFAGLGGLQGGPFNWPDLNSLIRRREITMQTLVWKAGFDGWIAAGEVEELKELFKLNNIFM